METSIKLIAENMTNL